MEYDYDGLEKELATIENLEDLDILEISRLADKYGMLMSDVIEVIEA